jgi:hypothetical protein
MFNILYKFYKSPIHSANEKKKYNIFLVKDIYQHQSEYKNIINLITSLNFPLKNKSISLNNLKLFKVLKFLS